MQIMQIAVFVGLWGLGLEFQSLNIMNIPASDLGLPISHQIQPTPQGHDVALAETLPVFHVPSWVVQKNHRRRRSW